MRQAKRKKGPSRLGAVGLSLICPGLGHLYLKQWLKAGIFLGISIFSIWKVSEPMRVVWKIWQTAYPTILKGIQSGNIPNISLDVEWMNMLTNTILWGFVFTVIFIWALIDAYISANRLQKKVQKEQGDDNT